MEAVAATQSRDDDGSAQAGGGGSRGGVNSECRFKTEPIESKEGLASGCVREGGGTKIFGQSPGKTELPFSDKERQEGAVFRVFSISFGHLVF